MLGCDMVFANAKSLRMICRICSCMDLLMACCLISSSLLNTQTDDAPVATDSTAAPLVIVLFLTAPDSLILPALPLAEMLGLTGLCPTVEAGAV